MTLISHHSYLIFLDCVALSISWFYYHSGKQWKYLFGFDCFLDFLDFFDFFMRFFS